MGESIGGVPEAPAVGDALPREPIGRYIAQQRRLRGIDLEELAERTRIPRRSLERLEAGAFDRSPDGFSRGFVRTVAEAIGLDPDDAVARMLPEPQAARIETSRLGSTVAALALLALGAAGVVAVRELTPAGSPASSSAAAPTPRAGAARRQDYVRELAEASGVDVARLTDRAAALPPLPPEEPAEVAVRSEAAPEAQEERATAADEAGSSAPLPAAPAREGTESSAEAPSARAAEPSIASESPDSAAPPRRGALSTQEPPAPSPPPAAGMVGPDPGSFSAPAPERTALSPPAPSSSAGAEAVEPASSPEEAPETIVADGPARLGAGPPAAGPPQAPAEEGAAPAANAEDHD